MRVSCAVAASALGLWGALCPALLGCGALEPEVGPRRVDATAPAAPAPVGDAAAPPIDAADDVAAEASPPPAVTHEVQVGPGGSHRFEPDTLTVAVGDTVRWTWSSSGHSLASGAGGSADGAFCAPANTACTSAPALSSGTVYEHVFAAPGSFPYFCRIHRDDGMRGTVQVVAR